MRLAVFGMAAQPATSPPALACDEYVGYFCMHDDNRCSQPVTLRVDCPKVRETRDKAEQICKQEYGETASVVFLGSSFADSIGWLIFDKAEDVCHIENY